MATARSERTAASSDDGENLYKLPTLLKTAYNACTKAERDRFDSLEIPNVELRNCCELLFKLLKLDRKRDAVDDSRQTMFSRSQFRFNDLSFENICGEAAMHGHIQCLKLAHEIGTRENGCTWNKMTCIEAAGNGHTECLVYARDNGCPWNEETCSMAVRNGHTECLVYALENGCPRDESYDDYLS